MAKKKTNPDENDKPRVHKELEGFDIQINSFGEITTSFDIDRINQFLNKTVDDKKLRHRTDLNLKGSQILMKKTISLTTINSSMRRITICPTTSINAKSPTR
ncbi:hypothetical protein [Spirosoma telluris]|uniref:hypothetical protein n=1 Tax=Spirosoma telluris TaxID=2183553 RepID=UPI0038CD6619